MSQKACARRSARLQVGAGAGRGQGGQDSYLCLYMSGVTACYCIVLLPATGLCYSLLPDTAGYSADEYGTATTYHYLLLQPPYYLLLLATAQTCTTFHPSFRPDAQKAERHKFLCYCPPSLPPSLQSSTAPPFLQARCSEEHTCLLLPPLPPPLPPSGLPLSKDNVEKAVLQLQKADPAKLKTLLRGAGVDVGSRVILGELDQLAKRVAQLEKNVALIKFDMEGVKSDVSPHVHLERVTHDSWHTHHDSWHTP